MTKTEIEHTLTVQRGKLLAIARRFIKASGSTAEAEDIVQEALTELWLLLDSGYQVRNLEALAVKVTKTICVRHHRQQKILTTALDGKDFTDGTEASAHLEMQEVLDTRQKLWAQLSDTQKQYLEMRNDQSMTIDQIATATGHPKSSIKATISQARKTMKELLDKISK